MAGGGANILVGTAHLHRGAAEPSWVTARAHTEPAAQAHFELSAIPGPDSVFLGLEAAWTFSRVLQFRALPNKGGASTSRTAINFHSGSAITTRARRHRPPPSALTTAATTLTSSQAPCVKLWTMDYVT
jgi:hypothetical protein